MSLMVEVRGLVKRFPRERMGSLGASWDIYLQGLRQLIRHREYGEGEDDDRLVTVLDGVDLGVGDGEFFGLLGPNGAGKSTLIKILCTLLLPDGGEAYLNGFNVVEYPSHVKASISVMVSQGLRGFDQTLSARHNLEFFASLYNMRGRRARERIDRALGIVDMAGDADRRMNVLSSGQKQRVALARGLVLDAPVLLMDEATVMLDPRAAREFRSYVQALNREEGKTVLWCTHLTHEAEELCHRVAILDRARVTACDTPHNLTARMRDVSLLEIEVSGIHHDGGPPPVEPLSTRILDPADGRTLYRIKTDQTDTPRRLLAEMSHWVERNGGDLLMAREVVPSLEDVFMYTTGRPMG